MNPYYEAWLEFNQGHDPCWKGDAFSGHEYVIWIQGRWDKFFNGKRPRHITPAQEQEFMGWLKGGK